MNKGQVEFSTCPYFVIFSALCTDKVLFKIFLQKMQRWIFCVVHRFYEYIVCSYRSGDTLDKALLSMFVVTV